MDLMKVAAGFFLFLSILSFTVYFLLPSIIHFPYGEGYPEEYPKELFECDKCAETAYKDYQSCLENQKTFESGPIPSPCLFPFCPALKQISATAGALFAFISACLGVYRLYLRNHE